MEMKIMLSMPSTSSSSVSVAKAIQACGSVSNSSMKISVRENQQSAWAASWKTVGRKSRAPAGHRRPSLLAICCAYFTPLSSAHSLRAAQGYFIAGKTQQMQQAGKQIEDRDKQAQRRHHVVGFAAAHDIVRLIQDHARH